MLKPISLLIKPASGICNMRCTYCFYTDEMSKREVSDYGIMTESTLQSVLKKMLEYAGGACSIMFQGGEPTCAGLPFFRKAVFYAKEYNVNNCKLSFSLQTNGYCLDKEWAEFLSKEQFLVGISLDGTPEVHDSYRKDYEGNGTFQKVMNSIKRLEQYGVDYNILTVVHALTADKINQIYRFYKNNHFGYIQFIECLEPFGEIKGEKEYSLTPEKYGQFLVKLFDKWYEDMTTGNYIYIRNFENLMLIMAGRQPESCAMNGRCQEQWTIEADGGVYPCDFYVMDKWKLGNLVTDSIATIQERRKEILFEEWSYTIPNECGMCEWFSLCRNGCRRNCDTGGGEREKNYLCNTYKEFFKHAYSKLEILVKKILEQQSYRGE